jgi:(1->4)-alpha-D-glucan 1-alpha-D-glucosylmutase
VPDVYQGCELGDYSFVDPDNRRPVDYAMRAAALDREFDLSNDAALLAGEGKLLVLTRLLRDRRAHPDTYRRGYTPVATSDEHEAIAFLRGSQSDQVLVVARRTFRANDPRRPEHWTAPLPPGQWRNLFDGCTLQGGRALEAGAALGPWPAAAMRRVE